MKTKLLTAILILWVSIAHANFNPKQTADTLAQHPSTTMVKDTTNDGWGDYTPRKYAVMVQDEENEPKPKKKKQHQVDGQNVSKGNRAFIYTTIATTIIALVKILSACK